MSSVCLPLDDHEAGRDGTQGSDFENIQLVGIEVVKDPPANIIPMKRQFTVEGRIWEPPLKSSMLVQGSLSSACLPLDDHEAERDGTQGSDFENTQLLGIEVVKRPANIIPMKRQFIVEGRIWEPPLKSSMGSMPSVCLPLDDHEAGRDGTQGIDFENNQLAGIEVVKRPADIIPMKRQLIVEGRIWEPSLKSSMVSDNKSVRVPDDDDDRISNLPQELIHCIIAHLPVYDAARTSVLSKPWRNTWRMHPQIILDQQFYWQVTHKTLEKEHIRTFAAVVNKILLSHTGPILDFVLSIPPRLCEPHVYLWIERLSKKGMRKLVLDKVEYNYAPLPSNLFKAKLTLLKLSKLILSHPYRYRSFANLIEVFLVDVTISSDVSFGEQLQQLELIRCTGIEHLRYQFSSSYNLRRLVFWLIETIDWQLLHSIRTLETFSIYLSGVDINMDECDNLIGALCNNSEINTLSLDCIIFEAMESCPCSLLIPKIFTTKMVNLKKLRLYKLGYNLCRISYSLCLIKNLPNLQDLFISLELDAKSLNPIESTVECHSESLHWKDISLDRLLSVKICGIVGSNFVLHLIKLLLVSTPSLRVMSLYLNKLVMDQNEESRFKQEVRQLHIRSSEAQLFWY